MFQFETYNTLYEIMDTIQEDTVYMNSRKKAKEIEVELETQLFSDNDRIVRKYFQVRTYVQLVDTFPF